MQSKGWKRALIKRHEKILGHDKYTHYLNCGDNFMGIYICQNLANCHLRHTQFIGGQLYFDEVFLRKLYQVILPPQDLGNQQIKPKASTFNAIVSRSLSILFQTVFKEKMFQKFFDHVSVFNNFNNERNLLLSN